LARSLPPSPTCGGSREGRPPGAWRSRALRGTLAAMTRPEAKAFERRVLDTFLSERGIAATVTPRERPDFELALPDGPRIGVELAELADPMVAKGTSAIDRLEEEVRQRLKADGLWSEDLTIVLGVTDGLGEALAPPKVRARQVEGIAGVVRDHLARRAEDHEYTADELHERGTPLLLTKVRIARTGIGVITSMLAHGRRGDFVQECFDKKNAKADEYRAEGSGEVWLVVYCGVHARSAIWSSVTIEGHVYTSTFDRVFCVDAYEGTVFEVKVRRP
jgi:hypothetical protein